MAEFFPSTLLSEWNIELDPENQIPPPNLSFTRLPPVDSSTNLLLPPLNPLPNADSFNLLPALATTPQEEDAVSAFSMACIGPNVGVEAGANSVTGSNHEVVGKKARELEQSPRNVAEAPASAAPPRLRLDPGRRGLSKPSRGGRSQAEAKRLQHNQTMRENREKANKKFGALQALLERYSPGDLMGTQLPQMRNKMQVLDRAMAQYPSMCARRARLRAELILSASQPQSVPQITTPDMLARILLASQRWKAAEIWRYQGTHPHRTLGLHTALLGANNTLDTANRLRAFCAERVHATTATPDPLVVHAAAIQANIWVPDLRTTESTTEPTQTRAEQCTKYGVSTAVYVPLKDGVLVLFHADDELLQFEEGVRPYEPDELGKIDELALRLRSS